PDDPDHLEAIVGCGGDRIRWILLTHHHQDHGTGARSLADRTGAPILGFSGDVDERIGDGYVLSATEFRLQAMRPPGHASDHLCYQLLEERLLFSGDHINDGQTVVINPPDGDMAKYLESLEAVRKIRRLKAIAPGHGHLITDPRAVVDQYI